MLILKHSTYCNTHFVEHHSASPKRKVAEAATATATTTPTPATSITDKKMKVDTNARTPYGLSSRLPGALTLVVTTEQYVKKEMAGNDGSHDWHHIDRVRHLALTMAHEQRAIQAKRGEAILDDETLLVVELAALLHDIKDWKYSGSETAGLKAVIAFLEQQQQHMLDDITKTREFAQKMTSLAPPGAVPASMDYTALVGAAFAAAVTVSDKLIRRIGNVVNNIGFKSELGADGKASADVYTMELKLVQDADRLDAIGAIGIARCFTFGGSKGRAIYDPACPPLTNGNVSITKEQYAAQNAGKSQTTAINHFYEKLLQLKGMMKTDPGRRRAEVRHARMQNFLDAFYSEYDGSS